MTYEEVKKRLDELSKNKQLLRIKQKRIEELKQQISLSAVDYSIPIVQGNMGIPMQQRYVERMEELTEDFAALLDKVMADEDIINSAADLLTPTEYAMLMERYLFNKSWRKIQAEFGYEESQPFKIHKKMLKKLLKTKVDSK